MTGVMHQPQRSVAPSWRWTRVLTSAAVAAAGALTVVVMAPAAATAADPPPPCLPESQTSAQWNLNGVEPRPKDDVFPRTGGYDLSVVSRQGSIGVLQNDEISDSWNDRIESVAMNNARYKAVPKFQATAVLNDAPRHAKSFTFRADGGFDWVPTDGYFGGDTFTYYLHIQGRCALARVTIPPTGLTTGVDDHYVGWGDDPIRASLFGVLSNDTNVVPFQTVIKTVASCVVGRQGVCNGGSTASPGGPLRTPHGVLTMNLDGTFVFQPDAGFRGTEQVGYWISTEPASSPHTLLELEVRDPLPQQQPLARDDLLNAEEDTPLTISASQLLANDRDSSYVPYAYDPTTVATREFTFDTPHGEVSVAYAGSLPNQYVGTMTYTPDPDYHGPDHFLYTSAASNPGALSNVARVEIDVAPRPDKPSPQPDYRNALQDQSVTVDVLANDLDDDPFDARTRVERFPSSCISCNGTWVVNPDNTVTYTPTPGFVGVAAWDYSVFDADGERGDSFVWLEIARDDARDDQYDAVEDTPLVVEAPGLRVNDPNPEIATVAPEVVDAPGHGSVTVAADGGFRYTPEADYHGSDAFTYAYRDPSTGQLGDQGTVSLDVAAVNDAPRVSLNGFCSASDICLLGEVRDVAEGGTVTVNGMIQDKEFGVGDLTLSWGDGSTTQVRYPCAPDAVSCPFSVDPTYSSLCLQCADALYFRFTHRYADDPAGDAPHFTISAAADDGATSPTVTTRAQVTNTTPTLAITTPGPIDATAGTAVTVQGTVDDPDLPPVSVDWGDGSASEAAIDACVLGTFQCTWSATHTYAGATPRTITATADDGDGGVGTATVEVRFAPVPDRPPVAGPVEVTLDEDSVHDAVAPGLLASASDPDGDHLTLVDHTTPSHGALVTAPNGAWTYEPQADYHGTDSFTYTVEANGQRATGTVSITVRPVNDPPVARGVSASTAAGVAVTVAGDVSDVDGDQLTLAIASQPGHGTAEVVDGRLRYTPAPGWAGADSFTYRAHDGTVFSRPATVEVTTRGAANQPPSVSPVADVAAVYSDPLAPVTVSATDDLSGPAALTFTATGLPAGLALRSDRDGTATVSGTVTAEPARYPVTVRVCDEDRACATTGFAVTVDAESAEVRVTSPSPIAVAAGKAGAAPAVTVKARVTDSDDGSPGSLSRINASSVRVTATPSGGGSATACKPKVSKRVAATATSPGYAEVSCTFAKGLKRGVYEISVRSVGSFAGSETALLSVHDPRARGASGAGTVVLAGGGSLQFAFQGLAGEPVKGTGALVERNAAGELVRVVRGMTLAALTTRTRARKSAQLTGKVAIDGVRGYRFVLTATDRGTPRSTAGAPDTLGLQVTAPSAAPAVSSLTFAPRPLVPGGNILIR